MKKVLFVLLCMTILLSSVLLNSCVSTDTDESSLSDTSSDAADPESSDTEPRSPYYDEHSDLYVLPDDMPEFDFDQTVFTVCVCDEQGEPTYYNEDILPRENTDAAIAEALTERNNILLERYGVQIKTFDTSDVATQIRTIALGGDKLFDAAMPFMSTAATLAADNKLHDLADLDEYIHLDAPWWEDTSTAAASLKGKTYFATGDISIMPKIVSFTLVFNKEMLADLDPSADLYREVREGKWTLDRLTELSKAASQNNVGASFNDTNAKWGLATAYSDVRAYYVSAGQTLCAIDANGIPQITIGNDRSVTVAQKLLNVFNAADANGYYICNKDQGKVTNIWDASRDLFAGGRCLFRTNAFSAVKKLRNYTPSVDFGLLPLPKFDETQHEYYTFTNPDYATCIVIPAGVEDAEFSAFMIEALACESKNHLTDAYYETVLKGRDARDTESEEMLDDYIFKNIVYDVGIIYNFNSIGNLFYNLASKGSSDISSALAGSKEATQKAIDDLLSSYE